MAITAARARQRAQTGFVHYCYESQGEEHDTIPLFENLSFVLALLRSRLSEHILEGKTLLRKLLAFEVEGHFPVYLHEYPECRNPMLSQKIYPLFYWIFTDFKGILGEELREKLEGLLRKITPPNVPLAPTSAAEWADYLVALQIQGLSQESLDQAARYWHSGLCAYIGPIHSQRQERGEPSLTLYDLFMGQLFDVLPQRALVDHPVHLQAALVRPFACSSGPRSSPSIVQNNEGGLFLAWGGEKQLHTLVCFPKKALFEAESASLFLFTLSESPSQEGEEKREISFFCNIHEENRILVEGMPATTFQLGERIQILSRGVTMELTFSKRSGEGMFFGHLSRANRPHQRSSEMKRSFTTYDWQIALRTVKRSAPCIIEVRLK